MLEWESFIDLIHRELDRELTGNEKELLHRLLAQDPDRREFRERLQRLHKALENVPDVKPPMSLRGKVMAVVVSPRPREAARGGRDITDIKRMVAHRGLPRLAYPLAAGFLGLAVLAVWWLGTSSTGPAHEPATASGTMGLSLDGGRLLDEASSSLIGLTARAGLYRTAGEFTLLLEMDAPETVEVAITCAPSDCAVREFSWLEGGTDGARFAAGRITATVTGRAILNTSFSASSRLWTIDFKSNGVSRGSLFLTAESGTAERGKPARGLPNAR